MLTDAPTETKAARTPARTGRARLARGRALCVAALVSAGLVGGCWPWVHHQLLLSFTRLPAHYTELGFTKPADLPTVLTAGSDVSVPVTVHNAEHARVTYVVTAVASTRAGSQPVFSARVALSSGQSATVPVGFTMPALCTGTTSCPQQAVTVTVALGGRPEHLDFRALLEAR